MLSGQLGQMRPMRAPMAPQPMAPQQPGIMTIAAGDDFHEKSVNQNADSVRLVSLGCYCGPKLSIRALGRDAETLPFDWVRTKLEGLLHFMRNDFDQFFHYDTKEVVPGAGIDKPMVMHRSFYHSFWHDDLSQEATFEKYRRRMDRFKGIDAHSDTVLFIRSVPTTDEVQHTEVLCDELQQRFGRCARLLLIVDFQPEDEFMTLNGRDDLLICKLHHRAHGADNNGAPYNMPITKAIEWAKTGRLHGATVVPSLSMVNLTPNSWGLQGLGGLDAFERNPGSGMTLAPAAASAGDSGKAPKAADAASATATRHVGPTQCVGDVLSVSMARQPQGVTTNGRGAGYGAARVISERQPARNTMVSGLPSAFPTIAARELGVLPASKPAVVLQAAVPSLQSIPVGMPNMAPSGYMPNRLGMPSTTIAAPYSYSTMSAAPYGAAGQQLLRGPAVMWR